VPDAILNNRGGPYQQNRRRTTSSVARSRQ